MSEEKNLEYYMKLPYTIELHSSPEGGYVAGVAELPGCITQGETMEESLEMIQDAMQAWIITALEDGQPVPEPLQEEYSGRFVLRLPKSLHRQLAMLAAKEGVSLNQYILYRLSRGVGAKA